MAREVTFFDHLGELLELERAAQRERYQEDVSHLTLGEREARGLCLLNVEATEESIGLGGRTLITFQRSDRQPLPTQLFPGDLVEVAPRKSDGQSSVQGVVSRGTRQWLQVAFDRSPPAEALEGRLRVDRLPNEVTFQRARSALEAVKAMERGRQRRLRELLLGNEPPQFDRLASFEASRALNAEQEESVRQALATGDFLLIHGPPGTGKSTVLAEIAVQLAAGGKRLLGTAASNAAVDHLLELCLDAGLRALRVGHPARVLPRLQEHTLDLLVENHPDRKLSIELFEEAFDLLGYARRQRKQGRSRQRFANARESSAEARRLLAEARALERKAVQSVLQGAQVVCSTLTNLEGGLLAGETFDVALLDEATQATEPLSLLAFLKAPRVLMAGDPQQLAPTVLSQEAQERGLGRSLFERLLEDHGSAVRRVLHEQYRMNEQIMRFPSEEMYEGMLRASPSVAHHTLDALLHSREELDLPPVLFLDTAGKGFEESVDPTSKSHFNPEEAQLVVARARKLLSAGLSPADLGVIAPYSAQVAWIGDRLAVEELEIDTVDAFQGREKEAVLVSLTRSNREGALGFLTDLRRMNVALTRARRHLFVVGDSATLSSHPFYQRFIAHVQAQGGYRSAWEWAPED